jgi:uncharacterized protein YkwD
MLIRRCLLPVILFAAVLIEMAASSHARAQCISSSTINKNITYSSEALEADLLRMTNQSRVARGLAPLTSDENLVQLARRQSEGMAAQGFISHELPLGDLQTRMSLGGYRYQTARENVASSSSLAWAMDAMLRSPAHRENLLAADVTRLGIGIVRCPPPLDHEFFITEIFASPGTEHKVADIEMALLERLGTLAPDSLLQKLAAEAVQSVDPAAGTNRVGHFVANSANELSQNGISKIDVSMQLLHDPKNLKIIYSRTGDRPASKYGTAIRQVRDSRNEAAFLVLTLIGFAN